MTRTSSCAYWRMSSPSHSRRLDETERQSRSGVTMSCALISARRLTITLSDKRVNFWCGRCHRTTKEDIFTVVAGTGKPSPNVNSLRRTIAYLTANFFEGGAAEKYRVVLGAAHPNGVLPAGQKYHFSGPTEDGWLVVSVWDSKESCDRFTSETLMPTLSKVSGGFTGAPQRRDVLDVDIASASL